MVCIDGRLPSTAGPPHPTGKHSTAQHSPFQHSAAQHSIQRSIRLATLTFDTDTDTDTDTEQQAGLITHHQLSYQLSSNRSIGLACMASSSDTHSVSLERVPQRPASSSVLTQG